MFHSSLKAIALVDNKIDYMLLQRRQIIKSVENRKDIQDPGNIKYVQLQVLITYSGRIRITGTMLYVANQIRSICSTLANLKPINTNKKHEKA